MKATRILALCVAAATLWSCGDSVDPIDLNDLEKHLTGTWVLKVRDAQEPLTDNRTVVEYDFDTRTSLRSETDDWKARREYVWELFTDYSVDPEKTYENVLHEYEEEVQGIHYYSSIGRIASTDLVVVVTNDKPIGSVDKKHLDEFRRSTVDYTLDVQGVWTGKSCRGTLDEKAYDHKWEFLSDGTFVYYSRNGQGQFVADTTRNTLEYFVAGPWLAMRWMDGAGNQYVECWDIAVSSDDMTWTAVREKAIETETTRYDCSMELCRESL